MALIKITDNLLFNVDKDNMSDLVFLDFKKAFDLLNQKIVLEKIGLYGGTVETVKWFESYFSDRCQCVKGNGLKSSLIPVRQGMPFVRQYYMYSSSPFFIFIYLPTFSEI